MPPFAAWAWLHSEAPRQFTGCDGVRSRDFSPRQAGAFAPTCRQPPGMASRRRDGLETDPTRGSTGTAMAIHCQPRSHRTGRSKIGPAAPWHGRKASRADARGSPSRDKRRHRFGSPAGKRRRARWLVRQRTPAANPPAPILLRPSSTPDWRCHRDRQGGRSARRRPTAPHRPRTFANRTTQVTRPPP